MSYVNTPKSQWELCPNRRTAHTYLYSWKYFYFWWIKENQRAKLEIFTVMTHFCQPHVLAIKLYIQEPVITGHTRSFSSRLGPKSYNSGAQSSIPSMNCARKPLNSQPGRAPLPAGSPGHQETGGKRGEGAGRYSDPRARLLQLHGCTRFLFRARTAGVHTFFFGSMHYFCLNFGIPIPAEQYERKRSPLPAPISSSPFSMQTSATNSAFGSPWAMKSLTPKFTTQCKKQNQRCLPTAPAHLQTGIPQKSAQMDATKTLHTPKTPSLRMS